MKRSFISPLLIMLCLLPLNAVAGPGTQALDRFFNDVHTLKADFVQTVSSEDYKKSEQSRGTLIISRPGKFRWDYETPYLQQIIADGKKLWIFDIDLDQVIVKSLQQALGNTPAVLLSGGADLGDKFVISDFQMKDSSQGLNWVELRPKDEDAGFQRLRLGFDQDLRQMLLLDSFGQETRIQFSKVQRNPSVDMQKFVFIPPPNVDVLTE